MSASLYILLFLTLLILSAVFSGAETAFFRLHSKLKTYGEKKVMSADLIGLLERPRRLLITLLTGNTIVNVGMGFLAAILTARLGTSMGWNIAILLVVESVVLTVIILLFGEVTPKLLAIRHTELFARMASRPIRLVVKLLYPIGSVIYGITHLIIRITGLRKEQIFTSEEEYKHLAVVGQDRGTLVESEREIIHSIFDFRDTAVHGIMVPRVDILALEAKSTLEDAIQLIRVRQMSKIPIYKESIDDIRGILYAKDILPHLNTLHPDVNLIRLSRPPFFVPESKSAFNLLKDFKERRTNIAIVVDEFGGTAGLVTLEDVVEEILGEIRDPYDLEEAELRPLEPGEFLVDAGISLADLADHLEISFPDTRDYDTLGGFLFDKFDKIPAVGQSIVYDQREFTVRALDGNRISKVHIGGVPGGNDTTHPDM